MIINCIYTNTPASPGVLVIRQNETGYQFDDSDKTFKASPTTGYVVASEFDSVPGLFRWYRDQTWTGLYQFIWYPDATFTAAPTVWSIYLTNGVQQEAPDTIGVDDVNYVWYEYEDGHYNDPAYAIQDVRVVAYNNSLGSGKAITSGRTDELGKVILTLDPGTYYLFRRKAGRKFVNPVTIEVG